MSHSMHNPGAGGLSFITLSSRMFLFDFLEQEVRGSVLRCKAQAVSRGFCLSILQGLVYSNRVSGSPSKE